VLPFARQWLFLFEQGLDHSGKTTLLYNLTRGDTATVPTIGINRYLPLFNVVTLPSCRRLQL
jgi:predicted ATPase